jgi:hypothetical protein
VLATRSFPLIITIVNQDILEYRRQGLFRSGLTEIKNLLFAEPVLISASQMRPSFAICVQHHLTGLLTISPERLKDVQWDRANYLNHIGEIKILGFNEAS